MAARSRPIILTITIVPVLPKISNAFSDLDRIKYEIRNTRPISKKRRILFVVPFAAWKSTIPVVIAPGPVSKGTARGVKMLCTFWSSVVQSHTNPQVWLPHAALTGCGGRGRGQSNAFLILYILTDAGS